jgi:hypothetical protein
MKDEETKVETLENADTEMNKDKEEENIEEDEIPKEN